MGGTAKDLGVGYPETGTFILPPHTPLCWEEVWAVAAFLQGHGSRHFPSVKSASKC